MNFFLRKYMFVCKCRLHSIDWDDPKNIDYIIRILKFAMENYSDLSGNHQHCREYFPLVDVAYHVNNVKGNMDIDYTNKMLEIIKPTIGVINSKISGRSLSIILSMMGDWYIHLKKYATAQIVDEYHDKSCLNLVAEMVNNHSPNIFVRLSASLPGRTEIYLSGQYNYWMGLLSDKKLRTGILCSDLLYLIIRFSDK